MGAADISDPLIEKKALNSKRRKMPQS